MLKAVKNLNSNLVRIHHLLFSLHSSSGTVEPLWYVDPVLGHVRDTACVQDPVTEKVIKFYPCTVDLPFVMSLGVPEMVTLGREHDKVLHVTPRQVRTEKGEKCTALYNQIRYFTLYTFLKSIQKNIQKNYD